MSERTEQRILALVARSDGISRIDLQDHLGLPAATITSAVARLLQRGAIAESAATARRSKSGRRPALLRIVGERPLLGVLTWNAERIQASLATFGGEVVAQCTFAVEGPEAVDRARDSVDVPTAAMTWLQQDGHGQLAAVVVSLPAPYQRGVGSPVYRRIGPPRPDPGDRPRWIAAFDNDPAAAWAERVSVPVMVENDANLAMIGEAASGIAAGLTDVVYLKLGSRSTGSGLLVGGRIHRGASGFAGEIAHLHVDDDGPLCACGGRGCLEGRLGRSLIDSVQEAYGRHLTFTDVLALADEGDPGPARILGDIGRTIGRALADLVTFLNPAAIVVDGSLGPAARFLVDGVREQIDRFAAPVAASSVRVLVGTLGERADLFGAIALSRTEALQDASVLALR